MKFRSDMVTLGAIAIILMILAGQVLLTADIDTKMDAELRDDGIGFSFSADYNTYYSATSLDNGDVAGTDRYIACYDTDHKWFVSNGHIENTLTHLDESMAKYGLDLETRSTEVVVRIMIEAMDSGDTGIMIVFMGGSLPEEIYDGTDDCLMIKWLEHGGKILWGNGPIGKYVSHSDAISVTTGYDVLLFGVSGAVNEPDDGTTIFDKGIYSDGLSDMLRMYYSECTNGIMMGIQEEQIHLDYEVDGYASTTIMKYHDGNGMMIIFGGNVDHLTTDYVTQILAAGLTYESVVVDHQSGLGKSANGVLEASTERPTLFLTLGMMNDYLGHLYRFDPHSV